MIVPCRNESENIRTLHLLMMEIPKGLEILLIEGGSSDSTVFECKSLVEDYPDQVKFLQQTSKGKMNAVYEATKYSNRASIAIFDADLTVSLKEQIAMIDVYLKLDAKAIIIGNRLNKKKHKGSMKFANLIGNKFFAFALSLVLKTKISDSLCGTKIFPKKLLAKPRCTRIRGIDPFGDFTIISESRSQNLKIVNFGVEYLPRRYGTTNIHRWRSGLVLLKILCHLIGSHFGGRVRHE